VYRYIYTPWNIGRILSLRGGAMIIVDRLISDRSIST
jgi:hypothetical protein